MKYNEVRLTNLKTWEECDAAVEAIENDYVNIQGGLKAWDSGYQTHLLPSAQKKIDAINRKGDRLAEATGMYDEYDD